MALNIVWGKHNDLVPFSRITIKNQKMSSFKSHENIHKKEDILDTNGRIAATYNSNQIFRIMPAVICMKSLSANKIRIKFRNILNFMKIAVFVIRVFTVCAFFRFL